MSTYFQREHQSPLLSYRQGGSLIHILKPSLDMWSNSEIRYQVVTVTPVYATLQYQEAYPLQYTCHLLWYSCLPQFWSLMKASN